MVSAPNTDGRVSRRLGDAADRGSIMPGISMRTYAVGNSSRECIVCADLEGGRFVARGAMRVWKERMILRFCISACWVRWWVFQASNLWSCPARLEGFEVECFASVTYRRGEEHPHAPTGLELTITQ